jgi:xylulokinase
MKKKRLTLGLDISTQGITAVVLDIDTKKTVFERKLDYCEDARLSTYGIRREDYILPPENEGEASQPALMFLAAIDAIFSDLKKEINMDDIVAVNASGQQHGHVYLNALAPGAFQSLTQESSVKSNLAALLKDGLAYERAPIWMTADTQEQAEQIRRAVGGKKKLIALSGSDAPLRFTGLVIRKIGQKHPEVYRRTENIQLISSLVAAVLTGNAKAPMDYGNACGMSLMDYRQKKWSDALVTAAADGLEGGEKAFRARLPDLAAPDAIVGTITEYFIKKYRFSKDCKILAGSGDNPQSKVLVSGHLLSLGSSIVNMVATDGKTFDYEGYANAMYDGAGKPFMFGCRTNGALVWDQLRAKYGLTKEDYKPAEAALKQAKIARNLVFWQPRNESFPASKALELTRLNTEAGLANDYSGLIESTLAAVYYHSRSFTQDTSEPLYVTGGAQNSAEILRRVAAIWNRPVIAIEAGGAALGAAAATAGAFLRAGGEKITTGDYTAGLLKTKKAVPPKTEDVKAFHGVGGYLEKFAQAEATLLED